MTHKTRTPVVALALVTSLMAAPRSAASLAGASAGNLPDALVGSWIQTGGSGSSYVDPSTGTHGPPNSKQFAYRFYANGKFEHAVLLQSSLYNCSMSFFGYESGDASVVGRRLTLTPQQAIIRSSDSCVAENNYEKPGDASASVFDWRLQPDPDGGRPLLVLVWPNGFEEVFRPE